MSSKKISFLRKDIEHIFQKQDFFSKAQKDRYIEEFKEALKLSRMFSIFVFKLCNPKYLQFKGYIHTKFRSLTFNVYKLLIRYYDRLSLEMNSKGNPAYLIEKFTEKTSIKYKIFPSPPYQFLNTKLGDKISPLLNFYYSDGLGNPLEIDRIMKIKYITLNTNYLVPVENVTINYDKNRMIDDHTGVFYYLRA